MDLLFSYSGRINRSQFWMANIIQILTIFIIFTGGLILIGTTDSGDNNLSVPVIVGLIALAIVFIGIIYSNICTGIKRYHDHNKQGWWIFITWVPVIGYAWYIIECGFLIGTEGPNSYGDDPLRGIARRN